ncbi:MAG: hypothetical protein ABI675_03310 [Chitinophagaceae bacterium]
MSKYTTSLFVLFLFACQLMAHLSMAQTEKKSLKESFADLKKSFHPDKSFILPVADSSNEDLQAFVFAVKETKGVTGAHLKMADQKAIVTVNTKESMVTVWKNLPKEIRTRYTVSERTPDGFILTDSYQTGDQTPPATAASAKNASAKSEQKQNTKSVYQQAEEDAAKDYKNPDTAKTKSIWDQQKDYAEKMRQRDKDMANEVYGKNYNLPYSNPEGYSTTPPAEKGEWYIEYTVNGKKVTMYGGTEKLINRSARRSQNQITFRILVPKPYNEIDMTFTDPANFPDIRKFEFGKAPTFSKRVKSRLTDPSVSENAEVDFHLSFAISGPDMATYRLSGTTGTKRDYDNIESGYFEVLYFDSRGNGILEANFALTVKGVKQSFGNKTNNLVITNGKMRLRLDHSK